AAAEPRSRRCVSEARSQRVVSHPPARQPLHEHREHPRQQIRRVVRLPVAAARRARRRTNHARRRLGHSQRPIVLPVSFHLAPMNWPADVPSFIGLTRTRTGSPDLKVVAFQPLRDSVFGLPPSMLHSDFWPLLSTTT